MTPDVLSLLDSAPLQMAIPGWIIPAIIAVAGQMFGKDGNSGTGAGSSSSQMTPEMRRMFAMEESKMLGQRPLYNDLQAMVHRMLPLWARANGGRPPMGAGAMPTGAGAGTSAPASGFVNAGKPGGNPNGPGMGSGQPDHTDPYNGWQPPRA